jgi:hypothetical protein
MKTKLIAGFLLAGGCLFAAPRISIGVGIGEPVPAYGYYRPAPVYVAPVYAPAYVAPAPGYTWVNGYWYGVGAHRVWRTGYWAGPRGHVEYRGRFRR